MLSKEELVSILKSSNNSVIDNVTASLSSEQNLSSVLSPKKNSVRKEYINIELEQIKHKLVRIKQAGHSIEIMTTTNLPKKGSNPITKLSKDEYVLNSTKEVLLCNHIENRSEDLYSISKSMSKLRDLINVNVLDIDTVRWVTLTYAENMTDEKRLYHDVVNFWKRFKYNFSEYEDLSYIAACEPQGRGAWHIHLIVLFHQKAPFIPNNTVLEPMWGHGWTSIHKLYRKDGRPVDNFGAYLTSYLGNIPLLDDEEIPEEYKDFDIKVVEDQAEGLPKRFIKGARLYLYPTGFHFFRCSRGLKKPIVEWDSADKALEKTKDFKLIYSKGVRLSFSSNKKYYGHNFMSEADDVKLSDTGLNTYNNCADTYLEHFNEKNIVSEAKSSSEIEIGYFYFNDLIKKET